MFAKSTEIKHNSATPTPSPVDLKVRVGVLLASLARLEGSEWFWREEEECGLCFIVSHEPRVYIHVCTGEGVCRGAHACVICAVCPLKLLRRAG